MIQLLFPGCWGSRRIRDISPRYTKTGWPNFWKNLSLVTTDPDIRDQDCHLILHWNGTKFLQTMIHKVVGGSTNKIMHNTMLTFPCTTELVPSSLSSPSGANQWCAYVYQNISCTIMIYQNISCNYLKCHMYIYIISIHLCIYSISMYVYIYISTFAIIIQYTMSS